MSTGTKLSLFFAIVVVPGIVTIATAALQFEHAKSVEFCGSCHVMSPWVADLQDPESENLAAKHFANRWITKDQCYTCHTDYDFLGGPRAKLTGMRHAAAYYLGSERAEIGLYRPYSNGNCLQCHLDAKKAREVPVHQAMSDALLSGETSCLDCHGPMHPRKSDDEAAG